MARAAATGAGAAPAAGADGHDAFEALFRREYGRVLAIARRVVGNPEAAADVTQEVFLAAFRARLAERPNATGWLCAAAAHTAQNHARSARRRGAREAREGRGQALAATIAQDAPEASVERAEERLAVRRLLFALPKRQAAILVLRHSGLTYQEVAQALGLSPASVGTLLRRAEAAMRREWIQHASE